jgi:hypothetical protein
MANTVGVRQYLQGQGLASGDIDYDKGSGYVTVKGQNFIKPGANLAGTTYDSQQNLDSAYGNYTKPKPVIQADGSIGQTASPGAAAGAMAGIPSTGIPKSTPSPEKPASNQYSNPYTQQIADLMKHLSDSNAALSQPVDVYSTPQYAAAQAAQQRQSADSIRHASESAAGAGLGHSTIMTDRTQHIQNDSDTYLTTQLVPAIIAQIQNEKQQAYQNEQAQFNNVLGLSDRADNQNNADRTFNYNANQDDINNKRNAVNDEATYKGIYNPSGLSYEQANAEMAHNSAEYATATPERQHELHTRNLELSGLMGKKFDPNTGKYSEGQGYMGTKTLASQQIEQDLETGKIDQQTAKLKLKEAEDPKSVTNQANAIDLQIKQLDLANYSEKQKLEIEQLRKNIAQIGVVHYKPQTEAEIAEDKVKLATATKQLADIATGKYPSDKPAPEALSAIDYAVKYIDGLAKYDNEGLLTNGPALETQILSSGKPEDEMRKMYGRYGLKWGG